MRHASLPVILCFVILTVVTLPAAAQVYHVPLPHGIPQPTPPPTPTPTPVPPPAVVWQPNVSYAAGVIAIYNGQLYKSIQPNTSQVGWEPPNVPALWQVLQLPVLGNAWVPNTLYTVGQQVSFGWLSYQCLQAHTSQTGWEPPNTPALWTVVPDQAYVTWEAGAVYPAGIPVLYNGQVFRATQTHTSQAGWTPPNATSLWTSVPVSPRMFAPYIYVNISGDSNSADNNLPQIAQQSGARYFSLAYVADAGGCTAGWTSPVPGPTLPLASENAFSAYIKTLQAAGGDAIVSFNGSGSPDLAATCPDVPSLVAQYQAVISKYGVTMLDFMPEVYENTQTTARRDAAIAQLRAANPGLKISYTFPMDDLGLSAAEVNMLVGLKSPPNLINILAMNYNKGLFVGGAGAAIGAADFTAIQSVAIAQVKGSGVPAEIGVTPLISSMPGSSEFAETDAQQLVANIQNTPIITRLSMFYTALDQPCTPASMLNLNCSGFAQQPYDFSHIFAAFH